MRTVQFRQLLDNRNALRVRFTVDQGAVARFVTQLECLYTDEWVPVIRYDNSHDFAHCDILHPYRRTRKVEMHVQDYNQALTYAIDDLSP